MKILQLALATVLLSCALPSVAASQPPETGASAEQRLAAEIVDVIQPDQLALDGELRAWEVGVRSSLSRNTGVAKVEAEHPGTIDAGVSAGRPIAAKYIRKALADIKAMRVQKLVAGLDAAELREFHAFAQSDTGRRFYTGLITKSDVRVIEDKVMERAGETGKRTISDRDAAKLLQTTLGEVHSELSSADVLKIMKFEASPTGKKLAKITSEMLEAMLAKANNPDPNWMKQQDEAMVAAMIAFVEAATKD